MNNFTFSGHLGRDAERRKTQGGTTVVSFAVPVERGFGDKKVTTWIDCAMWGKKAEGNLVDHLLKGTPVVVSGEVALNEFQKNDGTQGAKINVNVQSVTLMGKSESKAKPDAPDWDKGQQGPLDEEVAF